ncbi:MAG: hypothetical protein ACM3L8_01500 [Verrucomicrobiota bacterium]
MVRKLMAFLTFSVFVFAMAATSMADVWSHQTWSYGPNEGVDHTRIEQSVPAGSQMQGPMETGSLPDTGLSSFEQGIVHGHRTLNYDPANGYNPLQNWDSFPRENIEAGP